MTTHLKTRRVNLTGHCHLELALDPDAPHRYLVRFCGLDRDPAARSATEHVRVRQMLDAMQGRAPHPYPLPPRLVIGALDRNGWHCGRSGYARVLARMPKVKAEIDNLLGDLTLRVALAAAGNAGGE